ncbi:MAG: ATP-binding cassette domain-containing protein, partial [Clostridiaceae bacterium]|nr:ATP-binding cassette domain-containing protein [Clostridiaceae bacterium]
MLSVRNLVKRYGKFTAVDNLSMEINESEIFGFVGANGAGKTTTMRIIAG